jgi:hypothetical protein
MGKRNLSHPIAANAPTWNRIAGGDSDWTRYRFGPDLYHSESEGCSRLARPDSHEANPTFAPVSGIPGKLYVHVELVTRVLEETCVCLIPPSRYAQTGEGWDGASIHWESNVEEIAQSQTSPNAEVSPPKAEMPLGRTLHQPCRCDAPSSRRVPDRDGAS